MAEKTLDQNPRVTDVVVFELETPDADGCFLEQPYRLDSIKIHYVERDFLSTNFGAYEQVKYNDKLYLQLRDAETLACDDPTEANLFVVSQLKQELESTAQRSLFYYKEAVVVFLSGSSENPVWTSTLETPIVTPIEEDADGNPLFGRFEFKWSPEGAVREGDYFITWTWSPLPSGETLSAHRLFHLVGDPRAVITIPTHLTPTNKYDILLERYLPEMYKGYLTENDITPETLERFNQSVAKGFTFLEDFANQIIDLYDANAIHESLLVYLANFFNLKLKSDDPTLWRRQIKEAVLLFKKKGTVAGLTAAFAQAGMTLNKFTRLWQVVSPYTWQESFLVTDSASFQLFKLVYLPTNAENFGLWIRRAGEDEYVEYPVELATFETDTCGLFTTMTWIGDEVSQGGTSLFEGDIIKVLYQYTTIETWQQSTEDYIRSLPLADLRDEADQTYPRKNWNVRVIEEDDPLFDVIVTVRQPFYDPVVFGKVRTEFPYSENIYNMEEYNGSTRDSTDGCEIDRNFVDPCGSCLSSKFSIDVSIENISNERMAEVYDILEEYTPFHAQVQEIEFKAEINEFLQTPVERIVCLIKYHHQEFVLSGNANPYFHRVIPDGLNAEWVIERDQLAEQTTVVTSQSGTAYNPVIALIAPDVGLGDLGVITNSHLLEVLAPSANAGEYTLGTIEGSTARLTSEVIEPLNQAAFTFNLSNILYDTSIATITQDNLFVLSDESLDLTAYAVKTQWDVDNLDDYTGGSWKVLISAYSATAYEIVDIVDGQLILDNHGGLPSSTTTDVTYHLLTDSDVDLFTSDAGTISVTERGLVDLNDSNILDINEFVRIGDYLYYDGDEYLVQEIVAPNFRILDYNDGTAAGVNVEVRRRLVYRGFGYFGYQGLKLTTLTDHEVGLEIVNGQNPQVLDINNFADNDKFKENFLVQIDDDFYRMADIDGTEITLDGLPQDWMTEDAGGTAVTYSIMQFVRSEIVTQNATFQDLDRAGMDVVLQQEDSDPDTPIVALSMLPGQIGDVVSQTEQVSVQIQYRDGRHEQVAL